MNQGGLHSCGDARPGPAPRSAPRPRAAGQRVIDLHCHYLDLAAEAFARQLDRPAPAPPSAAAAASAGYNRHLTETAYRDKLSDIPTRLADMDAMGVDMQVISPSPTQYHYWMPEDAAEQMAGLQNARIAELCGDHPDRLQGFGTVALQHPRLAAEQLRHAVKTLGLRGVEISSAVNGVAIDDDRFAPFWREADALGTCILLHPLGTSPDPRLDDFYLSNVIGQPLETTIALTRLILSGHLDRYEKARICAVHGGGYLPFYVERLDHAWLVRPETGGCRCRPGTYLRRLWFDGLVYEPGRLKSLIDAVGTDRVVLGTDYPFDMGAYDPLGLVAAIPGLDDDGRAALLGGNASTFLAGE